VFFRVLLDSFSLFRPGIARAPFIGSYIVEFSIPTYLGLYPSFLVAFPYLGLRSRAFL